MFSFFRENARWLAAGALLAFTSAFGQTFFIAIFSEDVRAAHGLSHGEWGAIYAGGTLASALLMLRLGALADVFRARTLATYVLIGLAMACLAMAWQPSVWALPL
ncbi:MAG: MFS transporter, partial [Pseudomonadota bacterium]